MWRHRSARPRHVRDSNDEAHLLAALLHEGMPFELGGAELRLEIDQPALDLYQGDLGAEVEDNVSCATVRRHPNGDLKLHAPAWVRFMPDRLSDLQLPRVAQS